MAFEVISVGQFVIGLIVGLVFFAAAFGVGKFLGGDSSKDSMVPSVIHGLAVGILAIFGTVAVGMSIGFGCADPDYYEDTVESPEESDYGAELIDETDSESDAGLFAKVSD